MNQKTKIAFRERLLKFLPALLILFQRGVVLAQEQQGVNTAFNNIRDFACNIAGAMTGGTFVFAVAFVIIAWAGFQLMMGKREAVDTIIRAAIAGGVLLGASGMANALIGEEGC